MSTNQRSSWAHIQRTNEADAAALAAHFRAEGVRDVECWFPDVSGYARGKLMPAASFAAGTELRICQAIPMQCVTGEYAVSEVFPENDPDARLVPDMATLTPVPWASTPRYLALHDCVEMDGSLCDFAPRSLLKQVVARYQDLRVPLVDSAHCGALHWQSQTPRQCGSSCGRTPHCAHAADTSWKWTKQTWPR